MIPAILVGLGIMFTVLPMGYRIELARCPAGTFLAGLSRDDQARSAVLCVGGATTTMIVTWAALVQVFGKSRRRRTRRRPGGFWALVGIDSPRKKVVLGGAASVLAMSSIAVGLWAFTPKFCLTDAAILLRSNSSKEFHRYSWNEITVIDTGCYPAGRGAWHTSFVVRMRDGVDFDLMTAGREVLPVYPKIVTDLKGVDYLFVSPDPQSCGAPLRDLVIHRP